MIENTSQISILGTIYFSLTCFSLIMPSLHPGALGNHPIQIPPDFPPILKAYTKVRSCMYNPSMYDHKTTPEPESNKNFATISNFLIPIYLQPDGVNR